MEEENLQAAEEKRKKGSIASRYYSQHMQNNRNRVNQGKNGGKDSLADALERNKMKIKRDAFTNAISAAAGPAAPLAKAALSTPKGQEVMDDLISKTESPEKAGETFIQKIKIKKEIIITAIPIVLTTVASFLLPMLLILLLKNADSILFSEQGGNVDKVIQDKEVDSAKEVSVFTKTEDLYLKVNQVAKDYHNKYGLEIDRDLIVATLVSQLQNDEYAYSEKTKKDENGNIDWDWYVEKKMIPQVDLLAKYQIMEVIGQGSGLCTSQWQEDGIDMEKVASHDTKASVIDFFLGWIFYKEAVKNERNIRCVAAPFNGESDSVSVISTEEGTYSVNLVGNELVETKSPYTGGVYFWNLVGPKGFIFEYYNDYLAIPIKNGDKEAQYEANKAQILEIAHSIYTYRRGLINPNYCENYRILKDPVEPEINVLPNDAGLYGGIYDLETYVAGVMSIEFPPHLAGNTEALKAFAILARTYGLEVMRKEGSIKNSSENQNFHPNGINNKQIKDAVEATRGLVLTGRQDDLWDKDTVDQILEENDWSDSNKKKIFEYQYYLYNIFMSEYDSFCPTTSQEENGGYYQLTANQNGLKISSDWVNGMGLNKKAICPCKAKGYNEIHVSYAQNNEWILLNGSTAMNPFPHYISSDRDGRQEGGYMMCWRNKDNDGNVGAKICLKKKLVPNDYGEYDVVEDCNTPSDYEYIYSYKPSGGHGRGASQWGLRYFAEKGYKMEELLKLFYDRKGSASSNHHVQIMRLESSLVSGLCDVPKDLFPNATLYYKGEIAVTNKKSVILREPLGEFLDQHKVEGEKKNGLDLYKELIESKANLAGLGTGEAVAQVAIAMISSLDQTYKLKIPVSFDGGMKEEDAIIDGQWGSSIPCGPYSCVKGLSNSGFVNTVLTLAGFKYKSYKADQWSTVGLKKDIDTCDAKRGDLIWHQGAVMIILEKGEGNSFYVANAKSIDTGIIIEEIQCNNKTFAKPNYIIDMSDYYSKNKK